MAELETAYFGESQFTEPSGKFEISVLMSLDRDYEVEIDAKFIAREFVTHQIDCFIGRPIFLFYLSTTLVLDEEDLQKYATVIDATKWAWAEQAEIFLINIELAHLRWNLETAEGEILDEIWGRLMQLPRKFGEVDGDFKIRIRTRIAILTGSGTKSACESIIDRILNVRNSCHIDTYYPAEMRIEWNGYHNMRRAHENFAILSKLLDQMVPAGVTWTTSFPWEEFLLDSTTVGTIREQFDIKGALMIKRWWYSVHDAYFARTESYPFDIAATIATSRLFSHKIWSGLINRLIQSIDIKTLLFLHQTKEIPIRAIAMATQFFAQDIGAITETTHEEPIQIRAAIMGSRKRYMKIDYRVAEVRFTDLPIDTSLIEEV